MSLRKNRKFYSSQVKFKISKSKNISFIYCYTGQAEDCRCSSTISLSSPLYVN